MPTMSFLVDVALCLGDLIYIDKLKLRRNG